MRPFHGVARLQMGVSKFHFHFTCDPELALLSNMTGSSACEPTTALIQGQYLSLKGSGTFSQRLVCAALRCCPPAADSDQ